MKRASRALAFTLFALVVTSLCSHGQAQNQAPLPARSRAEETVEMWNAIGNKLIAMAEDFPEDKYDFKLQKDERTFAQNLLHEAALDFVLIRRISGSKIGPDFGEGDNPSRDAFKTKADVVKFVREAVADGAQVIQQQGDAGLDNTSKFFGNRLAHNSYIWAFAIEHSGEHYGQLVVYYRANNLVPPDSRRNQAQQSQPPAPAAPRAPGSVFRDCPDCPEMTATPALQPTGARTMCLRATPRRRTAKATASEWIAAARGCFRPGCDLRPESAIPPTTATTSWDFVWQDASLKRR
jgi:hypothetical protein